MNPYKVKELIRETVRFEPITLWLRVLQRKLGPPGVLSRPGVSARI